MIQLPVQRLPAVPHVVFGIFNLAIPNIVAWGVVIIAFVASIWLRLPDAIEHGAGDGAGGAS